MAKNPSTLSTFTATATWKSQGMLNFYRLFVAGLFLILIMSKGPSFLGKLEPQLFLWTALAYLAFSMAWMIAIYLHRPPFGVQIYIQTLVDIVAIAVFMYLSGGVTSGLGMLLVVAVAGGSLLMPGRSALLFAAVGAIALLFAEVYGNFNQAFETTAYSQTGILGAALFATALLSMTLAQRAKQSELLAARRGVDLANMAELNAHIINRLESGVLVIDDDGNIRLMNIYARKLLGQSEQDTPSSLRDISHPLYNLFKKWADNTANEQVPAKLEQLGNAGLQVRFLMVGSRKEDRGCVIYLEDTADINRKIQQTKLASLGRLTASIAHEIRNPLGAISHAGQLLDESDALDPSDKRLIDIIHVQSNRLNEIIENILNLSRRDNTHPESIVLKDWLEHFADEFKRIENLSSDWENIDITPEDCRIFMDSNHLHQVVWNLCTNAVKYGTRTDQQAQVTFQGGISPDSHAPYLDIIDIGPGIDAATVNQLFEPFFTTSETGTGLGLYISRELCENNGGDLSYIPNPMGGSCFRIHFPIGEPPIKATEEQAIATRANR